MSRPEAQPSQIDTLTALRFFAAAWVVLFHYWPALAGAPVLGVVQKGYLGVELFFVLSGFVISYVYQGAFESGRFRYGDFIWARLARIYPLHLLTLVGVAVMGGAALAAGLSIGGEVLDLAALPANLLMVHAWGLSPSASFNHPSWSISAEWFAYLSFPAFALLAMRLRDKPALAVAGALTLVFGLYLGFEALAGFPLTQATIHWGALRIVPCFALGCALHILWRVQPLRDPQVALAGFAFSLFAIAVLAQLGAPDAFLTMCFGSLIFSLACLWSARAVRTPKALVWLGEVSFSTYMICVPWKLLFVNGAGKLLGVGDQLPPVLWLVMLLALIPLSGLSHHLVERPARAWLKSHRPLAGRGATLQPAA
jgi:peptidoglycan/LPS O-acetylase OafA/YrhL